MPKQKQYEDALGSVFDFIFTESKKPPIKQKPVKVTGVDGVSEYVDAIAAVLENPGKFVNNTTVGAFNDLVNPDIASVDLGPGEKVKFSLLNVKDVLNNDMTFVDKQFARLENSRKMGKLAWAGEQLSGIVAATWARKYGLDLETQNALFNMGSSDVLLDKKPLEAEKKLGALAKSRDYLDKVVTGEFGDYRNIPEDVFKRSFGEEKGAEVYSNLQKVFEAYDKGMSESIPNKEAKVSKALDDLNEKSYQILYPVFESHNMSMKESKARAEGNVELADRYKSAQRGIDLFAQRGLRERYVEKKKDELNNYNNQLKSLIKSNSSTKNDDIKVLKSKIKDTSKELRLFTLQERAKKLGEIDGYLSSVKGMWDYTAGGQFVPAVLSGDFFDERKNNVFEGSLQPVVEKNIGGSDLKFKVPKVVTGKGGKYLNKYYQMMTDTYYLTPASWVKTLYTGEGFAYRAFKKKQKFTKLLEKDGLGSIVDIEKLLGKDGKLYLDSLTRVLDSEKYDKVMKFVNNNDRLQKLATRFGTLGRLKGNASKFLTSKFGKQAMKVRQKVGLWLLKSIKDGPARKLIGKWMRSGAFKVLLEGLKVSIKAALGATTGGASLLVGFLIDFAVDIAIKLGMKIAKPMVKIFFSMIIISIFMVVGVFALTLFPSLTSTFANSQYRHVAPNEIVLGQTDYKVPPSGGPGGGTGTPFDGEPLPDGVSCLLGSSQQYDCTQGAGGSYSHSRLPNAIDIGYIGYFYAPSFCGNGNCQVVENGDYPYCNGYAGGQVVFDAEYGGHTYRFKLVHVEMDPGLSVGDELSAGQVVARIMNHSETGSACSTGTHLHLEMWYDGGMVDPYSILTEGAEGGGFGCSLDPCG